MGETALRSALPLEVARAPSSSGRAGEPVSTAKARLMELDAAVRALRTAS